MSPEIVALLTDKCRCLVLLVASILFQLRNVVAALQEFFEPLVQLFELIEEFFSFGFAKSKFETIQLVL